MKKMAEKSHLVKKHIITKISLAKKMKAIWNENEAKKLNVQMRKQSCIWRESVCSVKIMKKQKSWNVRSNEEKKLWNIKNMKKRRRRSEERKWKMSINEEMSKRREYLNNESCENSS